MICDDPKCFFLFVCLPHVKVWVIDFMLKHIYILLPFFLFSVFSSSFSLERSRDIELQSSWPNFIESTWIVLEDIEKKKMSRSAFDLLLYKINKGISGRKSRDDIFFELNIKRIFCDVEINRNSVVCFILFFCYFFFVLRRFKTEYFYYQIHGRCKKTSFSDKKPIFWRNSCTIFFFILNN